MKTKLVASLSIMVASIMLGYLFFLTWLLGFSACKYAAGKSVGKRGRVRSVIIPFRSWRVHLHHWLCSLCVMILSCATGIHFLPAPVTYGLLAGLAFQGVYCYDDWHRVLVRRHETVARDR